MSISFENVADAKGAEIRWQLVRIHQFTFINQLLIGFSMTAIGFLQTAGSQYGRVAIALFALSVLSGTFCAYVRLKDFRTTARVARLKHQDSKTQEDGDQIEKMLKEERAKAACLGRDSWILLKSQLGSFVLGVITAVLAGWVT